ncbi:MAG: hypothetical protein EAX96_09840 [Candidatus Lokiarchaeota archaeon]|nr:hypothetical protein [Candidatus Lokiarchaeota archaeon]
MKNSKQNIKNFQQNILESFMSSSIKNLIKNGRILCPICGKKIQNLSRRLRFINSPASIYIFFSHIKCKNFFFKKLSQESSIETIKEIIYNTPIREETQKMKKEIFFETLNNFINKI